MILVTGGTGMVGAHVLFALAKKNLPSLALFRTNERIQKVANLFKILAPENPEYFDLIEWHNTDLNDLLKLEEAFEKATYVYHCAAKVSFAQYHTEKLNKTNIEGTANVVNLSLKYKVKKFAFVSSIASLGVEDTIPLVNESHLWNPAKLHTPYAYSKYGAELEVWRGSQEGLDVVVVNPGIILGSHFWERSSGTLIKRAAKGMLFYPTGNSAIVALEDVVKALVMLMESPVKNERFILISQNLKYRELIEKIATGVKSKKPTFALSKSILYLLYILDKTAYALGLKKSFLNRATIENLCSIQQFDGSKIENVLNFTYQDISSTFNKINQDFNTYF
jgi:nucleoside-diphosphate-sugar epimerase